ncbi:hypothetical protein QF000_004151 [Paraburkholderia atlantica]|uniref:Uncharacterized protein n=1 Tax=Paraburkholderia atlantica TaxID=2654982 RepID=A0A6I1PZ41_PARAM|nr:DUF4399 domain-containing protein [Paraburkholderia atlantica]MBB5421068.1 hypothetical protein [Paraburkholderia atlantica]MBB5423285.1 hypothetical protein [Paraburkholderia atlantica]MPW10446.1 DUF4399 domain-containing protein [Paraburkholderia atlantica]NUY34626.1 DUF4399 domain-containing protein [Paraburkholderia atlantica]
MRRTRVSSLFGRRDPAHAHCGGLRAAVCATLVAVCLGIGTGGVARAEQTASPPGAEEYIIWPSDGAVIHGGKLWVRMGLRNMGVCPKGIAFPNTGHHHLLIDTDLPALDQEIPSDRQHLHFGAGETDARIELPPGKHTLQLILGDHHHVPHNPPVYSKKITITVVKD